jgi:DNA-binding NtrC family response regulator
MKNNHRTKKILLIDDDPTFCFFMQTVAKKHGIKLDTYHQLVDATYGKTRIQDFDALILDYDLGDMTGVEVAEYVDYFMGGVPVLLISSNHRRARPLDPWPSSVIGFVHKNEGYENIFDAVLQTEGANEEFVSFLQNEEDVGHEL